MEKENAPFLSQEAECYEENIKWLKDNGLIEKDIKPEDVICDVLDGDYYTGE